MLEGSVRKSGDRLLITAQLINVSDGYRLWLEKACEERNGEMVFLNIIARVGTGAAFGECIRKAPRFAELLRRAGLTAWLPNQTHKK